MLLLEDIESINEATSIVNRLQKKITSPILLDGHEVFITASIGIALSSGEYLEPTNLLRDADTAMYRAKELGQPDTKFSTVPCTPTLCGCCS